ncbi:MAG: LamG domain-containing protein, partial [Phycisphaerales bacterium]
MCRKLVYLFPFVLVLALVGNATGQIATNPIPANGGEIDQNWVALGWVAGAGAVSHDVYLGDNFANVEDGTGGTFRGNVAVTTFLAGFPGTPYPEGLIQGTTYYWRIDEVLADATVVKGLVWSFLFIGPTARHPSPADGARFIDLDTQLSWSPGAGAIMHYVYFGDNLADVDAGTGDTDKGVAMTTTFSPGPLESATTYYWRIDEFDGTDTHKGDIWSFRTRPAFAVLDPHLVGWWKLDDEGTGTAIDYSGNNRDGTLHGDPQFVPGADGDALEFDGDDYVLIDGYKGIVGDGTDTPAYSITAWVRCTAAAAGEIVGWGSTGAGNRMEFRVNGSRLRHEPGGGNTQSDTNMNDGEWHHCAVTVRANSTHMDGVTMYLDGQVDTRANSDSDPAHPIANFDVIFGQRYNQSNDRWFTGALDDIRIYDKELTLENVGRAMMGDPRLAWAPVPADGSEPFIEEAILSWTPGDSATQHDVYLDVSELAVLDAEASDMTGIYRGRQDANSYTPPEILEFGETYYWRVDEV